LVVNLKLTAFGWHSPSSIQKPVFSNLYSKKGQAGHGLIFHLVASMLFPYYTRFPARKQLQFVTSMENVPKGFPARSPGGKEPFGTFLSKGGYDQGERRGNHG
jgi:hypothetical protein